MLLTCCHSIFQMRFETFCYIFKFVLKAPKQMMKNNQAHDPTSESSCYASFNEKYLTRILMFFGWFGVQAGQ